MTKINTQMRKPRRKISYMSTPKITAPGLPQTREMYEAEQKKPVNVSINTGGYASITHTDGMTETVRRPHVATGYARAHDLTKVTVNGAQMTRDQYIRLKADGAIPPGAVVDDPYGRQLAAEAEVGTSKVPFGDSPRSEGKTANSEGNKGAEQQPETTTDPAAEAVFANGQTALDRAREAIGNDAVAALVNEAVASGDLETIAATLDSSKVSPEQMGRVVAAYTASANEMAAAVGITVDTMSDVLSADDLRAARQAVVQGDVSRMRHLASKAVDELASLPVKNPEGFAEYIDQKFPGLVYEVQNGRTVVHTDRGWMPFDNLVRTGLLRHAKLVPLED